MQPSDMRRRCALTARVLCLCAGLAAAAASPFAQAQAYPAKPVRIVTGYAAGGGADIIARLLAEQIGPKLGQSVIVENRTGAGTNIASQFVARAAPDGYTLLFTSNNHNLNAMIYANPGYDPVRDLIPVIQISEGPSLLAAHPGTPFRSLRDVIDAARARPRALSYGSSGVGTPVHMAMELLLLSAGIEIAHVPYKGAGQSVIDAVGGHIPLVIGSIAAMKQHIDADKLRPLAVSTSRRSSSLPEVPTMAEAGYPDAVHLIWLGIVAPTGTPPEIVARLHREFTAALQLPGVRERLDKIGLPAAEAGSTRDFEALLKADFATSRKLVNHLKLKAE
ncbi:MAG: tripartite tricarboxylate transporter substrate binding protein [Burkholderiales bacterium]|nr:tripartite tricarboxylate transporter substrate binding protein [Burkholderiales bacterium]